MSDKLRCPNCGGSMKVANKRITELKADNTRLREQNDRLVSRGFEDLHDENKQLREQVEAQFNAGVDLAEKLLAAEAKLAAVGKLPDKWGDIEAMNILKPDLDCETHDEGLAAFGYCANELQAIVEGE